MNDPLKCKRTKPKMANAHGQQRRAGNRASGRSRSYFHAQGEVEGTKISVGGRDAPLIRR